MTPAPLVEDPRLFAMCRCLEYVRQVTKRFDRSPDNHHYWHVREACVAECLRVGLRVADLVSLHDRTSGVGGNAEPEDWVKYAPPDLLVEQVLLS